MTATESQRTRYMRHELTHSEYYGLLVEYLGEDKLRAVLPNQYAPAKWRELIAEDEHLNNVPLSRWDACDNYVRSLVHGGDELRAINGSGGWSLSDTVCVLKETARRYAQALA